MKDIVIKLASNFQTIEFKLDDLNEDLTPAIELINKLGAAVINDTKTPVKRQSKEEMATEKQIKVLKAYGVKNAENYTRGEAWKKLKELTNNDN